MAHFTYRHSAGPAALPGREPDVLDVVYRLVEQASDVVVVEPIDGVPPSPLACDELEVAQQAELVRDGRLLHPHLAGELTNRARALAEPSQNPHAARSGKRLHCLGHAVRSQGIDASDADATFDSVAHI